MSRIKATTARLDEFRQRLDVGTVIFAPYLLALTREYAWPIRNQLLAWMLATALAAIVFLLYVRLGSGDREKLPRVFWLIVALPLLLFYLLRVELPDISFDVLNYHIFHGERGLRGPLLLPGDFFPTPAPYNPAPDILTGLYRHLLGYRLGTIVNYVTVLWTGSILYRLLRDYFKTAWLKCASVLFILLTEQALFQINNYMVDLLAVPLLLEATRLAIETRSPGNQSSKTIRVALLLGVSTAFKLSNLVFGIPIAMVCVFNLLWRTTSDGMQTKKPRPWQTAALATLAFVTPPAPFTIHIYRWTGNPVFPFCNSIFQSPFWPQGKTLDPRWGPYGLIETFIWPIVVFFKPERMSEFAVYSGRISIGFVVAAICLVLIRGNRPITQLSFITLLSSILWSAGSGYSRYAIYLEFTSGLILVWFLTYVWKQCGRLRLGAKLLIQIPLWAAVAGQTWLALNYANQYEWSMRATIFEHRLSFFVREAKGFFRDRSLIDYLAPDDRALLDDVDRWVETTFKTTGLQALLRRDVPVLGARPTAYFDSEEARAKFDETLRAEQEKRLFTLTDAANLQNAREVLASRRLTLGKIKSLSIPYFSQSIKLDMLLVEVLPGSQTTAKALPLPDSAFKAGLSVSGLPDTLRSGRKYTLAVRLKNESQVNWPGRQSQWQYQITVGDLWLNEQGAKLNDLDGRAALTSGLAPGESIELPLTITAPIEAGNYVLQFDAIQEGVAWFGDRGSPTLNLRVKVQ